MMSNLLKYSLVFFLWTTASTLFSQQREAPADSLPYLQMTGIVITDSMSRIPFAKVVDITTKRGVIADYYGYYALVVHPGDTLQFSCLGFKPKRYIVSKATDLKEFSLVQVMHYDTLTTDPVEVYPWPSKAAFADAFVNMKSPNDDLQRARKRLTPQEMAFVGALLASDATSSYSAYRQQWVQQQYTRGQQPVNNLLNPVSWAQFINGLGTGKYQISD